MGLDMYIFKMKKISREQAETCRGMNVREIDTSNFSWYFADRLDGDISEYCYKMQCKDETINHERLIEGEGIPKDYKLNFSAYEYDGSIAFTFRKQKNKDQKKVVRLTEDELKKYMDYNTIDVYIGGPLEEFHYWRKAYDIADLIDKTLYEPAENCGFYCLDSEALNKISVKDPGLSAKLERDTLKDDEIYVYHPWW